MRKKITAAATCLAAGAAALLFTGGPAQGHGYSQDPMSRQAYCANGQVTGCGPIQWEPQSVEGPKGFPEQGPADGKICAGGNEGFHQLDDPRDGNWPTTDVKAGQDFTFQWTLTARHATTDFSYYITKDGWDPSKPLTRADLEPEPFLTVPMNGQQPPAQWTAQGTLPEGKQGRHLILGVWTIDDTANAFYSCADVTF
ncbi:lytic polysaccharide monooxygenase auxiliary activity family 9 protein [Streptomyces boncukensis]|uniref:Lytic polysaccharide monooxygenase n=1 Tax=Streptomyces boncukensis TaxID=2711219 RepID=A0A6G4WUI3_9ACTN|nr:lytic polysaccharide monooxygenase auxiliary activity family 9 protein [Streptomyces boncukensis]NGO68875.1 lytic polysaccharide monooxygenase [Streptomyces boncukensis]